MDWKNILLIAGIIGGSALAACAQNAAPVFPVTVLAQSPAETKTDLQIICVFQASADSSLRGSLLETDQKLDGLLEKIWKSNLFRGDLGETILLQPEKGTLAAKQLLVIGLGDPVSFTPERMYVVGKIAYHEASRLGIARPFFAPTIKDAGVDKYMTGEVSEQVVRGFRDAMATDLVLRSANAAESAIVPEFTYLAGAKYAEDTRRGIDRALGSSPVKASSTTFH